MYRRKQRKNKMFLRLILYGLVLHVAWSKPRTPSDQVCLTGYMTDIQKWVTEDGALTNHEDPQALDISGRSNTMAEMEMRFAKRNYIQLKYLSLARCQLKQVPKIFLRSSHGTTLATSLEYISLYGNEFMGKNGATEIYDVTINATNANRLEMSNQMMREEGNTWSVAFTETRFHRLKELDLRACGIEIVTDHAFSTMPTLEALYIGENSIVYIYSKTFYPLVNLVHLDLSRNSDHMDGDLSPLIFGTKTPFRYLKNLQSLDLSFTRLAQKSTSMFTNLTSNFTRLSLCQTKLSFLTRELFKNTSIKYLDISGNPGILNKTTVLLNLRDSLEVLYAEAAALESMDIFKDFRKLQILKLTNNEIPEVNLETLLTLESLQILDLTSNKITNWFTPLYAKATQLRFLSLIANNINVISKSMINDLFQVQYLGLSRNVFICTCQAREFVELAIKNELNNSLPTYNFKDEIMEESGYLYHYGYHEYHHRILKRIPVTHMCSKGVCTTDVDSSEYSGNFLLFDFKDDSYQCLSMEEKVTVRFGTFERCDDIELATEFGGGVTWQIHILLSIPVLLLVILILGLVFRKVWCCRYFCITFRNSATLSFMSNDQNHEECTTYNYDVFVSYCNEDRAWVLDHLLPRVEKDSNVSVCLHERDFQVGLSILENIVSCMDRSRTIMLVISLKFLLSQWCQFEMHLAQHRLLETRREDLILVLLEDIPRRRRPNTLHYLMLTKTYIVWPSPDSGEAEREQFWRRVNKTLNSQKTVRSENTSLA